jgi:hypothetical protein
MSLENDVFKSPNSNMHWKTRNMSERTLYRKLFLGNRPRNPRVFKMEERDGPEPLTSGVSLFGLIFHYTLPPLRDTFRGGKIRAHWSD